MAWKKKLALMKHTTDYLQKRKGIKLNFLRWLREIRYLMYYQWKFYLNSDIPLVSDDTLRHPHWAWHITSSAVNMNSKHKCLNDPYVKFTLSIFATFQSVSRLYSSSLWAIKCLWVTCLSQYIINSRNDWSDTSSDMINLPVLGIWFVKWRLSLNNPEQSFSELSLKTTSKIFH